MIEIELPWPPKELSPNSTNKWAKIKATKEARHDGYYLMMEQKSFNNCLSGDFYITKSIYLEARYTFYPPDRRRRDQDNYSAMMKPNQDGVCDALGVDDSRFQMAAPVWGEVVKGGRVVLRLEEMK